MVLIGLATG